MPGFRIRTDCDADKTMKLARRAALDQGFTLSEAQDSSFSASRGSMALTILAGGMVSYNSFRVRIEKGHGDTEIIIEGNHWLFTGLIGQGREVKAATAFGEAVAACIEKEGGKVLASNVF